MQYLANPLLPGLPVRLSWEQSSYWIPAPPEFHPGECDPERPDLVQARIFHDISKKEVEEDGIAFSNSVILGVSYRELLGSHF